MLSEPEAFNPEPLLELVEDDFAQLREILELFLDTFADTPDKVRQALLQHNTEEAGRLLHQLKGTIANIWRGELLALTTALEASLHSGTASAALQEQWQRSFVTSIQAIRDYIQVHCGQA